MDHQHQEAFEVMGYLECGWILSSIVFFMVGRVVLINYCSRIENTFLSEDDYCILVEDIPPIPYETNDTSIRELQKGY